MDNTAKLKMSRRDWLCTEPLSTRYALGGVCVRRAKRGAWLLATSGRHLSVRRDEAALLGKDFSQGVVPPVCRGVRGESVEINALKSGVASTDTRHAKLIEGRFPKVEDVLGKTPNDSTVVLVRPQYIVDIAKLVSGEVDESVYLVIDKDTLRILVVGKNGIGVVMCKTCSEEHEKDARVRFDSTSAELKVDCNS